MWIGSRDPNAVQKLDPRRGEVVSVVELPGNPCSGLALGFGCLWVPLNGDDSSIAQVDLHTCRVNRTIPVEQVTPEGGAAASADSIWFATNENGALARIDPSSGSVRGIVQVPAGSFNPVYTDGLVWITQSRGSTVTAVDAVTGRLVACVDTGPAPRFLTAGYGGIWTLNQGDGTLTHIDPHSRKPVVTVALNTPGPGGDIAAGAGMIWTTVRGVPLTAVDAATATVRCQWVGQGGDSVGVGHGYIWLVYCRGGEVSQISVERALAQCVD